MYLSSTYHIVIALKWAQEVCLWSNCMKMENEHKWKTSKLSVLMVWFRYLTRFCFNYICLHLCSFVCMHVCMHLCRCACLCIQTCGCRGRTLLLIGTEVCLQEWILSFCHGVLTSGCHMRQHMHVDILYMLNHFEGP